MPVRQAALLILASALFIFGCSTSTPPRVYEEPLEITEINPNKLTALAKQNIFHLAKIYDLKPFLFTRKIQIQSHIIPHSHPVLTLNTRHAEKPHHLLATWMHEEFHWWLSMNVKKANQAIAQLEKLYPGQKRPTYLHLIINFLEYRSLVHFLGEKEARKLIGDLIEKDKLYPGIYSQVLKNENAIREIVVANELLPSPLK